MKKYLVIGNPINHSLSPKLHNFWIKQNQIDAIYDKAKLNPNQLEDSILKVRGKKIFSPQSSVYIFTNKNKFQKS